ncbi:MAG: hypothetical protein ABL953_04525 [Ilumatobacteraceae bacterium]
MAFNEKIKVLIDVDASKGNTGLRGFRNSVSQANGAVGKFKAGASSAFATLKANAGAFAMAAGAALIGFAIKAVHAFEKTAKAAVDLGKKTGLATEQASRWIAVGDDFEVSADSLAGALGKVVKTLDSGAWKKYGIATRDASGEARSTNDIFLDALDVLNKTTNATERARIGNELFGKGYAAIAPLVGKTRAEYETMLGAVEKGQVITDKEAAKAERMRKAEDALGDALAEVTLAFGEFVAGIAPVIETTAEAVGDIVELADQLHALEIVAKSMALINPFTAWETATDIASIVTSDLSGEVVRLNGKLVESGDAAEEAATEIETLSDSYSELLGNFSAADTWDNVKDNFDAIAEKGQAAWDAAVTGAADADKKTRDYEASLRDAKKEVIEYAEQVGTIPATAVTQILALIDQGKIAEAEAAFDELKKPITRNIYANTGPISNRPGSKYAKGTSAATGGPALVGEHGPEIVNLERGDSVTTANAVANLQGAVTYVDNSRTYVTIPNATPEQTAAKIARFNRRNAR